MDSGHFNCRDYHIDPQPPYSRRSTSQHIPVALVRHESWSELELRARSPASRRPKFPLLALPLELRQHILRYVLPYTTELRGSSPLAIHVRNFSAVKKLNLPPAAPLTISPSASVVWHKGTTALFAVCQQLHSECADLVYGINTFILFVTFSGISIRFRYLLRTGVSPTTHKPNFLDWIPPRYFALMRKLVIHIDHVDQYTGQIKFNVGGKGLVYGLQRQVQRLVDALQKPPHSMLTRTDESDTNLQDQYVGRNLDPLRRAQITQLTLRISNGSAVSDSIKNQLDRHREPPRVSKDLEAMLSPFLQLRHVQQVSVGGAIAAEFAAQLETQMRGDAPVDAERHEGWVDGGGGMQDVPPGVQLCVYGNDL